MEKYLLVQHYDGITLRRELIVDSRAEIIRYSDTGIRMGRYGAILKTSLLTSLVVVGYSSSRRSIAQQSAVSWPPH